MRSTAQPILKNLAGLLRRPRSAMHSPPIKILGLLGLDPGRGLLADICRRNGWDLVLSETCEDARADLIRLKPQIVLCDRDLPGADWRDVVQALASVRGCGCIILLSRVADDPLWNEVVHRGGYEVLSKPLREDHVRRAVKLASAYWEQ
ncbi:MAG TPA: response regulator, partial [Bryobacteraceae bacterium]|nr:response regulator [Bryobacteraceae bacterium]